MEKVFKTFKGVKYVQRKDGYFSPQRKYGQTLHQAVWVFHNGPIPQGFCIHHKDENKENNDISNLECMSASDHNALHHAGVCSPRKRENLDRIRPLTKAWHRSKAGRGWHSQHGKKCWEGREPLGTGTCLVCGKSFEFYFEGKKFCSRRCSRKQLDDQGRYEKVAQCPICGADFVQNKYRAKPETCSRRCGASLKRERRAGRIQPRSS